MHRRTLLASLSVGAVSALAGCGASCSGGTDVRVERLEHERVAERYATLDLGNEPDVVADIARRAVEGEEPELETACETVCEEEPPLPNYVERNGTFHEITERTVATGRASGRRYELARWDAGERSESDDDPETAPEDATRNGTSAGVDGNQSTRGGEENVGGEENADEDASEDEDAATMEDTLAYEELPRPDRRRVSEALGYAVGGHEDSELPASFVAGYVDPAAQNASVLADGVDAERIEIDGDRFALEHLGSDDERGVRRQYRAEVVAEDVDAFADEALGDRGAVLEDASDDVGALLEDASEADGELTVCARERNEQDDDVSEAVRERRAARRAGLDELQSTRSRIERERGLGPGEDLRYVRYDGQWYRFETSSWAI